MLYYNQLSDLTEEKLERALKTNLYPTTGLNYENIFYIRYYFIQLPHLLHFIMI